MINICVKCSKIFKHFFSGRRDILGAAETGSGKTLAFGLPILAGIMSLKAKAEAKGLDVYDIPYKKTSNKKKKEPEVVKPIKNKMISKKDNKNNKEAPKPKESSEEGYSSGEDSNVDNEEEDQLINNKTKKVKTKSAELKNNIKIDKVQSTKTDGNKIVTNTSNILKATSDDDYLEEIEVPIRKRDTDKFDESDESDDNYIHLSDMLDSDDLADSSDDDDASKSDDDNQSEEVLGNDISDNESNVSSLDYSNDNDLSENEISEESDANKEEGSGSELENDENVSAEEMIEDSGDEGDEEMIVDNGGILALFLCRNLYEIIAFIKCSNRCYK